MKKSLFVAVSLLLAGCGQEPVKPAKEGAAPIEAASSVVEPAFGPSVTVGDVTASEAWVPVTPAGGRVAAGYLTLKNAGGTPDKLVSLESPRARAVEVHEMATENGMMVMRRVDGLTLKAGETVTLAPSGMHLMLLDPALPYAEGELLPVTLTFEKAGKLQVMLLVRQRGASDVAAHDMSDSEMSEGHMHDGH